MLRSGSILVAVALAGIAILSIDNFAAPSLPESGNLTGLSPLAPGDRSDDPAVHGSVDLYHADPAAGLVAASMPNVALPFDTALIRRIDVDRADISRDTASVGLADPLGETIRAQLRANEVALERPQGGMSAFASDLVAQTRERISGEHDVEGVIAGLPDGALGDNVANIRLASLTTGYMPSDQVRRSITDAVEARNLAGEAEVLSGNRLRLEGKEIRLEGVDGPQPGEICYNEDDQTYDCGAWSKTALRSFLDDKMVDCEIRTSIFSDSYIGSCKSHLDGVEVDLAAWMVMAGILVTDDPEESPYKAYEDRARKHDLGLWSGRFSF